MSQRLREEEKEGSREREQKGPRNKESRSIGHFRDGHSAGYARRDLRDQLPGCRGRGQKSRTWINKSRRFFNWPDDLEWFFWSPCRLAREKNDRDDFVAVVRCRIQKSKYFFTSNSSVMSDLSEDKGVWQQIIYTYKEMQWMWDKNCQRCSNRGRRSAGYFVLWEVNKMLTRKENVGSIKSRIEYMRNHYIRESKKVRNTFNFYFVSILKSSVKLTVFSNEENTSDV